MKIFPYIIAILFCSVLVSLVASMRWAFKISKNPDALKYHRQWAWVAFWFTLAAVLVTETMVRLSGGLHDNGIFKYHLPFAILFLLTLISQLKFTGVTNPKYHRIIAYVCLGSFLCTFVTGLTMLALLI